MIYEVALVNPKTNKQKKIFVTLSPDQVKGAKASPCEQCFIQDIARTDIPAGFMPIGNDVRPQKLQ